MSVLVWDSPGSRVYETGLDKGVLYLSDGSAVPWNGLTSVIENLDKESSAIYFDGMKIQNVVVLGDFNATMKAVTYPDEFIELEGVYSINTGIFVGDQPPKTFDICYRTQIGNDLEGDIAGYKIHIIYNLTAVPTDKTYASVVENPTLVEFEWKISAVPQEIPGHRPSAHVIIDTTKTNPLLLEALEVILYGDSSNNAELLPMSELVDFLSNWHIVSIIDNGDGTWSATTSQDGYISIDVVEQLFTLTNVDATYLDADTYSITDTD